MPMTTQLVLERITQDHGEAVLGNSDQLLGLFTDYSKGQMRQQQNQLRSFLECQGNTRILSLRGAAKQRQQAEYVHLLGNMVDWYSMKEEDASDFIGAFWRVGLGTEPPVDKLYTRPDTQKTIPPEPIKPQPISPRSIPSEPILQEIPHLQSEPKPIQPVKKSRFLDWPKPIQWLVLGLSYLGVAFASSLPILFVAGLPLGLIAKLIFPQNSNNIAENWMPFLFLFGLGIFGIVLLVKHIFRSSHENSMRAGYTDVAKRKRGFFAIIGGLIMMLFVLLV